MDWSEVAPRCCATGLRCKPRCVDGESGCGYLLATISQATHKEGIRQLLMYKN